MPRWRSATTASSCSPSRTRTIRDRHGTPGPARRPASGRPCPTSSTACSCTSMMSTPTSSRPTRLARPSCRSSRIPAMAAATGPPTWKDTAGCSTSGHPPPKPGDSGGRRPASPALGPLGVSLRADPQPPEVAQPADIVIWPRARPDRPPWPSENHALVPLAGTVDDRHGGPGLPLEDGARCDVRVLPAGNGGALVHEVLHCDPPPAEVLVGPRVEDDFLADAAIIDPSERDAVSSSRVDGVPLEPHTRDCRQGLVDGRLHP